MAGVQAMVPALPGRPTSLYKYASQQRSQDTPLRLKSVGIWWRSVNRPLEGLSRDPWCGVDLSCPASQRQKWLYLSRPERVALCRPSP